MRKYTSDPSNKLKDEHYYRDAKDSIVHMARLYHNEKKRLIKKIQKHLENCESN